MTRDNGFACRVVGLFATMICASCGVSPDPWSAEGTASEDTETVTEALSASIPTVTWHGVTGVLKDIDMANANARWGIDTHPFGDGFHVVKWVGSSWAQRPAGGVQIAVRNSIPWVVTASGSIWRATNTDGTSWVQLPGILGGDSATTIGAGGSTVWVMGQPQASLGGNSQAYIWSEPLQTWLGTNRTGMKVGVVCDWSSFEDYVVILDKAGNISRGWPADSTSPGWVVFPGTPTAFRNDIAIARGANPPNLAAGAGFTGGPFVTRSAGPMAEIVKTTDRNTNQLVSTGSFPFPITPIAVSADCSNNRIWILTNTTSSSNLYYGD